MACLVCAENKDDCPIGCIFAEAVTCSETCAELHLYNFTGTAVGRILETYSAGIGREKRAEVLGICIESLIRTAHSLLQNPLQVPRDEMASFHARIRDLRNKTQQPQPLLEPIPSRRSNRAPMHPICSGGIQHPANVARDDADAI